MIQMLSKLNTEEDILGLKKGTYRKSAANITFPDERSNYFPNNQKNVMNVFCLIHFQHSYLTSYLKF